jgi:CubicO group peptidase (beta-lactamase class C family)
MRSVIAAVWIGLCLAASEPVCGQQAGPARIIDDTTEPEGMLGQQVAGLIGLINAPSEARIREFSARTFTGEGASDAGAARHVSGIYDFAGLTGGVRFYSTRTYDPPREGGEMVVVVRPRLLPAWMSLVLTPDPAAEGKMKAWRWGWAHTPEGLPAPEAVPEAEFPARAKAAIEEIAAAEVFSGTVIVAKGERVVFEGAWGLASRDYDVPMRLDTKLNLASMGKMFTAVAVAQLVEQGKLRYEDTIDQYLDETWLPLEVLKQIRIEHLLTHTSGLGTYHNEKWEKSSRELYRELADYKPLIADDRPAFTPGTKWSYSNTGFHLLGAIIEKASGENYFDYIREHVCKPAGMTGTDCYELDKPVPNLAVGYSVHYTPKGTTYQNNVFRHVLRGGPAGGGFSTAPDLLRFARALVAGKLVSQSSLERLWSPRPDLGGIESYGMGFVLGTAPGGEVKKETSRWVGHGGGGGDMGISSDLLINLDTGWVVIVLSNTTFGGIAVSGRILELLGG